MTSASAFATPAATVPTPTSDDQLDVDAGPRVRALEVEDQLLEVLDRVDVVVRRRRDQARRPASRAASARSTGRPCGRQLAALAGLGALRELDLDVVAVDEVHARDAEPAGRDLLDGALRRRSAAARSARGPRRPRRCSTSRRGGSSRSRASRAPPARSSRSDIAPVEKRLTIDDDRLDLVDRRPARARRRGSGTGRAAS